ncbi:2-keto-4-pentenoate hydratase [Sagittula marina]|uniref:2-keto-4-pentenoate hydratase n=1 Tax=Sagittula marina TaxID=943940 RepID=A0A7W6GSD7_9RHOB|nr:hydratase [Sagittula marina]MBB3985850.1 2-keto-4-pentenoate hydratase [Sagittula marina]
MTNMAERVADILLTARETGQRGDATRLPVPDYAEALDIQSRLLRHLGPISGFKVGAFRDGQPAMAPIPRAHTFDNGADVPARDRLGLELEIGFDLLRAPDPAMRDRPQDYVVPRLVLELCDQRLSGEALDPAVKLADMQLNHGLVLGPVLTDWDGGDFGHLTARLQCGADLVVDGPVSVPGGSALRALWVLMDHLGDHCGGLQVGQTIITGSVSGLEWFPPGTDVQARIEGFGDLTCRLVQA